MNNKDGALKTILKRVRDFLLLKSLEISNKQRNENKIKNKLSKIVPDLNEQYSTYTIDMNDEFLVEKVRCQHTFQMMTLMKAIQHLLEYTKNVLKYY